LPSRYGHGAASERIQSPVTFFGSGFEFLGKTEPGTGFGVIAWCVYRI